MNFVGITPELMALFGAGFWHAAIVFLRVGAMTSIMPAFGETFVPTQIRLVIGLVFTAIVAPAIQQIPMPQTVMQYAGLIATEVVVGLGFGMALRMFMHMLQTAGSIAAQSTSLSQVLGGAGADPMPALGAILWISGITLAVMLDLHIRAAELLIRSYDLFPVGEFPDAANFSRWGVHRVSETFSIAFTLAAPFLITAVIYNLTLGVVNRAMPQLMVVFIGAPAITFGGLALLMIGAPMILEVWSRNLLMFFADPGVGMP
ncbi:flagellar biosynthetic protein FliR [Tritonibacter horizontis]|uniref:Flagellar biosynthesis protein FliR n=1 Tax=Tritonibacter horizontis TaxID=1768241 RepID=A0A132C2F2_9RHOB|nr:flagellar biosynthetic protein FliR [Tritonibacter horizontis]KUP94763.1 flagellar biosynthesis protein FliR [Tritonibacter horizontis]